MGAGDGLGEFRHQCHQAHLIAAFLIQSNGYGAAVYNGSWAYSRVDGQYSGTTDMIFRWAACKWGIDEDLVRAIATIEVWRWNQPQSGGDERTSYSQCVNGGFTSLWDYQCTSCCYQSWSIFQTKAVYNWQTWPMLSIPPPLPQTIISRRCEPAWTATSRRTFPGGRDITVILIREMSQAATSTRCCGAALVFTIPAIGMTALLAVGRFGISIRRKLHCLKSPGRPVGLP